MRRVIAPLRSRASFFTLASSRRSRAVSSTLAAIFSAASGLRWSRSLTMSCTFLTRSPRISVLPSLFLVCDSKIGSFSRIATAPTSPSRTSSPSYFFFVKSLTALSMPSRNALRCVPPSLVYWPLTNE